MDPVSKLYMMIRAAMQGHANDNPTPGYTTHQMMTNQLPMGTPVQDPAQFSGPYYQTPYGPGQMFTEQDIPSEANPWGRPLGYQQMWPTGFVGSEPGQIPRSQVYGDLARRANSAYPNAGFDSQDAETLNLDQGGGATFNAESLRMLMRTMGRLGASRQIGSGR